MDLPALEAFCDALPGTTRDVKWGDDLCFCVGEKMFAVTGLDRQPVGLTVKVPTHLFGPMTQQVGIDVAPYVGRYGWVRVADCAAQDRALLEGLIRGSYELVLSKLSKKRRREATGG